MQSKIMEISCFVFILFFIVTNASRKNSANIAVDVLCESEGISVRIVFERPFEGIVYSKGFYSDPQCRYVTPSPDALKMITFTVNERKCGTNVLTSGNSKLMINTVVVQQNPVIETPWDSVHNVTCDLKRRNNRMVTTGLNITGNSASHTFYSNQGIRTWLDMKLEPKPLAKSTNQVKVGDKLFVMVYASDGGRNYDLKVKNCIAHDDEVINENTTLFQLSDSSGCPLQPDLFSSFNVTKNTDGVADIMSVASMFTFRFTDRNTLFLSCGVELCRNPCPTFCFNSHTQPLSQFPNKQLNKRSIPSEDEDHTFPSRNFEERRKLMKATINALATKLMKFRSNGNNGTNIGRRFLSEHDTTVPSIEAFETTIAHFSTEDYILDEDYEFDEDLDTLDTVTTADDAKVINFLEEFTTIYDHESIDVTTTEAMTTEVTTEVVATTVTGMQHSQDGYYFNVTKVVSVVSPRDNVFLEINSADVAVDMNPLYCFPRIRFALVTGFLSFLSFGLLSTIISMVLYIRKEKKKHLTDNFLLYNFI